MRASFPRFTEEARKANQGVVVLMNQIAQRKNAAPAQIALAWLLAQKPAPKPWIVPIPGTAKIHRLEENVGSAWVELTAEDLKEINTAASNIPIQRERVPESNAWCPMSRRFCSYDFKGIGRYINPLPRNSMRFPRFSRSRKAGPGFVFLKAAFKS